MLTGRVVGHIDRFAWETCTSCGGRCGYLVVIRRAKVRGGIPRRSAWISCTHCGGGGRELVAHATLSAFIKGEIPHVSVGVKIPKVTP